MEGRDDNSKEWLKISPIIAPGEILAPLMGSKVGDASSAFQNINLAKT
jgi:hypothetical protein